MDQIILLIAGIIIFIILIGAAVLGAATQSWGDEKRKQNGLGPKGQGRNW